jgi:hypothetical protein
MVTGKVIYGILGATSAVTTLVSTRIYPHVAPQGTTMPYVIFSTVQVRPSDSKAVASKLDVYEVELVIYDKNYTSACSIAEAIRTALDQYTNQTVNTIVVQSITFDSGMDMYDDTANVFIIQHNYNMRIAR